MKVYLVIERDKPEENMGCDDNVFGVFTSKEKANKIKDDIIRNFAEHNETITVTVLEMNLDEPTEDYHWFMTND